MKLYSLFFSECFEYFNGISLPLNDFTISVETVASPSTCWHECHQNWNCFYFTYSRTTSECIMIS